jgi:hypothetical protein
VQWEIYETEFSIGDSLYLLEFGILHIIYAKLNICPIDGIKLIPVLFNSNYSQNIISIFVFSIHACAARYAGRFYQSTCNFKLYKCGVGITACGFFPPYHN